MKLCAISASPECLWVATNFEHHLVVDEMFLAPRQRKATIHKQINYLFSRFQIPKLISSLVEFPLIEYVQKSQVIRFWQHKLFTGHVRLLFTHVGPKKRPAPTVSILKWFHNSLKCTFTKVKMYVKSRRKVTMTRQSELHFMSTEAINILDWTGTSRNSTIWRPSGVITPLFFVCISEETRSLQGQFIDFFSHLHTIYAIIEQYLSYLNYVSKWRLIHRDFERMRTQQ